MPSCISDLVAAFITKNKRNKLPAPSSKMILNGVVMMFGLTSWVISVAIASEQS